MSETHAEYKVESNFALESRLKLNLTRRAMARALGLTVRAIQAYESGEYEPSKRTIRSIETLLDNANEARMAREMKIPFSKPSVQPPLPIPMGAPSSISGSSAAFPAPAPIPAPAVREPTPTELMNRIAKLERLILAWFCADSKDSSPAPAKA